MRPLVARDILAIWERGQHQTPLDRALTILIIALPERTRRELAALSIGERDATLLSLHQSSFGTRLRGWGRCPDCSNKLTIELDPADLMVRGPEAAVFEARIEGIELRFRLPSSLDLAAVAHFSDLEVARGRVFERCVIEARDAEGRSLAPLDLDEAVLTALADRMGECDPQAEILLDFACPACGHPWQMPLEITSFFWSEVEIRARRLLDEIHRLALAYGWTEEAILGLSPRRRRYYLEQVDG